MTRIPESRLAQVVDRFEAIEAEMASTADADSIVRLSQEHAELKPVAEAARTLSDLRRQLDEAESLARESDDAEMRELAEVEADELRGQIPEREKALQLLLLPKDRDDQASVVLEVRAGTGGDEAALFAGDLFRMYQRYAQERGWKVEIESESPGEVGGYKEIVATIEGAGVFGRLKWESGVHRVQRVPETEASGRIHTSAATVAVLPQPEDVEIEIRQEDIRVDTMRASGAGGQHVNKTDSAVRMTHIPSGIVVMSSEKSQHQNRARALQMLKARLYDQEREARDSERAEARASQVGSGDRSERIRTYNFPQGRVSDHRINLTLHKLEKVLEGESLDEILDALIAEDQAQKLAAMEAEKA